MPSDLSESPLGIDVGESDDRPDGRDDEETEQFVLIAVGDHRLAVPADDVRTTANSVPDLTRVPRSPSAVVGLVELRGVITAVIEPRVFFPTDGVPADRPQLLELDPPSGEHPAAVRVDDVLRVESVPASDVLEPEDVSEDDLERYGLAGNVLEHPLVVGVVRKERRPGIDRDAGPPHARLRSGADGLARTAGTFANEGVDPAEEPTLPRENPMDRLGTGLAGNVDLGPEGGTDGEESTDVDRRSSDDVEREGTPLLDVERLLLASGRLGDES